MYYDRLVATSLKDSWHKSTMMHSGLLAKRMDEVPTIAWDAAFWNECTYLSKKEQMDVDS